MNIMETGIVCKAEMFSDSNIWNAAERYKNNEGLLANGETE